MELVVVVVVMVVNCLIINALNTSNTYFSGKVFSPERERESSITNHNKT